MVPGLDVSELLRQPGARCAGGQGGELAVEVGLVRIAAVGGQPRQVQAGTAGQTASCQVEADHPGGSLGGEADVGAEAVAQVPLAEAGVGGQLVDAQPTTG